jgi:hypothetical protein
LLQSHLCHHQGTSWHASAAAAAAAGSGSPQGLRDVPPAAQHRDKHISMGVASLLKHVLITVCK